MNKETIGALHLVLLSCALIAQDFSGSWSNGKDGFESLVISFRKDGKGMMATAVATAPLRWTTNNHGIKLLEPAGKRLPNLTFHFDAKLNALVCTNTYGQVTVLTKVSSEEPPDIESAYEKQRRAEGERALSSVKNNSEIIASPEELFGKLKTFLGAQMTNAMGFRSVRTTNNSWTLGIQADRHMIRFNIPVLRGSVSSNRAAVVDTVSVPLTNHPPDLPMVRAVREADVDRLTNYLSSQGVHFEIHANEFRSLWRIEGYERYLDIYFKPRPQNAEPVLRFLLFDLFTEEKGPFELTVTETGDH